MKTGKKKILQSVLSVVFIVLTIGAGHLLMITVEHFDAKISADEYKSSGSMAVWKGDVTPDVELKKMIQKKRVSGDSSSEVILQEALREFSVKGYVSFTMLPVSSFLVLCTLITAFLALLLLVLSRFAKNNATQTVIGIFAGLMSWLTVEHGLIIASRHLGLARRFDVFNETLIGIRGEYVLLKYSWVFLLLVIFYLLFQEGVRCNVFVFLRRRLKLMRGGTFSGRIDNYAPRVAFFYTSAIWTFYVILLLAFDEKIFGVYSWFTYSFFLVCFSATGYLFYRLIQQGSLGPILRYSIGVALVFWSDIEILVKWGKVKGPWLTYQPFAVVLFAVGLFFGVYLLRREIIRGK